MEQTFCLILMALVCSQATAQNNGDIRLVDGKSTNSGRLEIYLNGGWGTVCYNMVSRGAAQAACKQLGHSDYEKVDTVQNMGIPAGKGTILLSNVDCVYNSENQHILRCSYSQLTGSCDHTLDMAITCSPSSLSPYDTAVRLVNGGTDYTSSGTVEVYLNNEWGTICDYEITVNEANTICRQLGYTSSVTYSSTSSPASTRVWLGPVDCVVSQPCLDLCFTYPSATNSLDCSSVAIVNCTFDTSDDFDTPGSETLCTSYVTIEKHLVAIIVGALVAFLCICLLFVLIPIICCCCCIPGCILHSCRERRVVYQVIQ